MNLKTLIGQLRLLAILEGISYISFALTMPLKYIWDIKEPNFIVGMAHGILFMAYVIWVSLVHFDRKLPLKTTTLLMLASIIPFGTFVADSMILKKLPASEN